MVRPRQFTDRELLDAARDVFLEHGPGVSTTLIAEAAGVSQATLFKRFGTKKALMVRALLPNQEGPHFQVLLAPPDHRPIPEQLEEKGLHILAFFNHMQPCIAMLRADVAEMLQKLHADGQTPPPVRGLRAMQHFFDQLIADGRMKPVPTEALALTWLGALRNRSFFRHLLPSLELEGDDATYVRAFTQMLWHGLAPAEVPQ